MTAAGPSVPTDGRCVLRPGLRTGRAAAGAAANRAINAPRAQEAARGLPSQVTDMALLGGDLGRVVAEGGGLRA